MTAPGPDETDDETAAEAEAVRRRAARERDRQRVFGDVLDDTTVDDRPGPDAARDRDGDRWLLDNVPPHHGA